MACYNFWNNVIHLPIKRVALLNLPLVNLNLSLNILKSYLGSKLSSSWITGISFENWLSNAYVYSNSCCRILLYNNVVSNVLVIAVIKTTKTLTSRPRIWRCSRIIQFKTTVKLNLDQFVLVNSSSTHSLPLTCWLLWQWRGTLRFWSLLCIVWFHTLNTAYTFVLLVFGLVLPSDAMIFCYSPVIYHV